MGKVSQEGWESLSESIRLLTKTHPEFDFVICHNGMNAEQLQKLRKLDIPLFEQRREQAVFPVARRPTHDNKDFFWKLVPPRLRPGSHELWVDNDIIIRKRIKSLDRWLESSAGIISSGHGSDYGRFTGLPSDLCAGFFGLPPRFDFASRIIELCDGKRLQAFDEQGLVATTVTNMERWIRIPLGELEMMGFWTVNQKFLRMPENVHFARLNEENKGNIHRPWKAYKLTVFP